MAIVGRETGADAERRAVSDDPRALSQRLTQSLRAGVRGIALTTRDEARAIALLEAIATELGWPTHVWTAATGFDRSESLVLSATLERARSHHDDELWIVLDGHASLGPGRDRRLLRELAQRTRGPALVLVEAQPLRFDDVPELVHEHLALPDLDELGQTITEIAAVFADDAANTKGRVLLDGRDRIARELIGLDLGAAERILAECLANRGLDVTALCRAIREHKARCVSQGSLLESTSPVSLDHVGGMKHLKAWLDRRALAFAPAAHRAGIPDPRGLLLVGVSGCGKSLAARACADALGLGLVRLDPGRLFGSTVGESEANLRRTCETAERLAPVVLWIDEIDKSLAGSEGAASDAGTAARVIAGLLTWLQERQRPVFVVATANDVSRLPPELLRRGRLDETFFVDLPDANEREAIAQIHLLARPLVDTRPRYSSTPDDTIPPLADPTSAFAAAVRTAEGFSGAEIEAALIEARLDAFAEGRPLAADDFARALAATVPLSRSRPQAITALRHWAEHGARRA